MSHESTCGRSRWTDGTVSQWSCMNIQATDIKEGEHLASKTSRGWKTAVSLLWTLDWSLFSPCPIIHISNDVSFHFDSHPVIFLEFLSFLTSSDHHFPFRINNLLLLKPFCQVIFRLQKAEQCIFPSFCQCSRGRKLKEKSIPRTKLLKKKSFLPLHLGFDYFPCHHTTRPPGLQGYFGLSVDRMMWSPILHNVTLSSTYHKH